MHTSIYGTTLSGKSTLARKIAAEYAKKKHLQILVYDPTDSDEWPESSWVLTNEHDYLHALAELIKDKHKIVTFHDEADTLFSQSQKENFWIYSRGRHFGLKCFLITQRPYMVSPTVRSMCSDAYIFRLSESDAKTVAGDHALAEIQEAVSLPQGHYYHACWIEGQKKLDKKRLW